jgi:serine/threonine protein kinase
MPEQPLSRGEGLNLAGTDKVSRTATADGDLAARLDTGTEAGTALAPPFRPQVGGPSPGHQPPSLSRLASGQRLGDFELLQVLGAGSFARVFLARQLSLDRQVALKISANLGSEPRTLAGLQHDHIVQVFSETVDRERDLRLLCMQYVPGTTLEHLIDSLRTVPSWQGTDLLAILDGLQSDPVTFDPAALRDREYLRTCDLVQAVCWLGTRLAEALAHAHRQGVLHRDLKPANILVNRWGRPLLADFNLAWSARALDGPVGEMFGGTMAYMAPEHLDAFNAEEAMRPEAVDQRSDIYALGVVLFELLTGKLPFGRPPPNSGRSEALRSLAQERRQRAPSPRCLCAEVSEVLDRIVRRCLDPQPAGRYQTAAELAQALEGCRRQRRSELDLPIAGKLTRALEKNPLPLGLVLMVLPHVLASVVNIAYNQIHIVGSLTALQQAVFPRLVVAYNLLVYTVCLALLWRLLAPILRAWRHLSDAEIPLEAQVAAGRRQALAWPRWAVWLSCLGWLPGALLFPLGLHSLAEPVAAEVFGQFFISTTLAGLIALTYAYFAAEYVVLRVLYPRFWVDARNFRELAREELAMRDRRLRLLQLLAGLIPLAGAALLVGVGPEQLTLAFRFLLFALLALGMAGFGLALLVSSLLGQTLNALIGSDRCQTRPWNSTT